ncbi:hypothetical protein ACNKHN_17080 [Shigella flexneri]
MRQNARALEADGILRACVAADFYRNLPTSRFWAMNWTGRAGASV